MVEHRSSFPLRRAAEYGLAAAGVVALAYCTGVIVKAKLFQAGEWKRFNAAIESRAPSVAVNWPHEGAILGQLSVPRLGLSVIAVEGVEEGDLKKAVGHIPGTALPGQNRNLGIAGHRDTFFRPLRVIRLGDTITLKTVVAVYRYRIVSTKVVGPDDVQVLYPDGKDNLTLVTCVRFTT